LRELINICGKNDIARGPPIIPPYFFGYDGQGHRRGPSSLFAHWALKGIDSSISRIWREARRSKHRSYDLWIYSDHGQEKSKSYINEYGITIEEAVSAVFTKFNHTNILPHVNGLGGIQSQRIRNLGGERTQKIFARQQVTEVEHRVHGLAMTAMGPLAHVYIPTPLTLDDYDALANDLVHNAHIPLVLFDADTGKISAWTKEGKCLLPEDKEKILGADHPFLAELCRDLIALCQHPESGDFVLCGWRAGGESITFPQENGSHCGPGPEETRGFSLLPDDTVLPEERKSYLRPHDLRTAAFHILGRSERRSAPRPVRRPGDKRLVRVMTYNVHSCIGMDGKISPERIARVIAQHQPDIVALQEVDVGKSRTGGIDQAHRIAQYLQMDFHFYPTFRIEEELYGDAILTHFPMQLVKTGQLPGLASRPQLEPRGAIWVRIKIDDKEIQCINTHLGLFPKERRNQVKALIGNEWLGHPECHDPVILCGDFNAPPSSPVCQLLKSRLMDVQLELTDQRPKKTFFGRYPLVRIDHIFTTPDIDVVGVDVPINELSQVASDHLPLTAEIRIP
ncbi:MAG: oxidoreductase, partial [Desulfobulbaceae bacterium]|nr:oxidoreductase [Desulfobulbaceae bacterium]